MPDYCETQNAKKVIGHATDSFKGFIEAFTAVRRARNASGAPTDEEQDLARAALVFAAAGLDSCIKHLIKDSLESLARFDQKVGDQFLKFAKRIVLDESGDRLAAALLTDSPRHKLLENYIYELTGSSLQSFDELAKAAGALGIEVSFIASKKKEIMAVFTTRNKIIHELDVTFGSQSGRRERNSRSKAQLEKDAKLLLQIGKKFITSVEKKLEAAV